MKILRLIKMLPTRLSCNSQVSNNESENVTSLLYTPGTNKGGDDDIEVDINAAYVTVTQVED